MEAVKVSYLKDVEYIYDNGELIAVRHTDSDSIIVDEAVSPYTEEEIRAALWPQE